MSGLTFLIMFMILMALTVTVLTLLELLIVNKWKINFERVKEELLPVIENEFDEEII